MKKIIVTLLVLGLLGLCSAEARGFTLKSSDVGAELEEAQVYSGFGCKGGNISPALQWVDPPEDTKSFAVTLFDPDAPTGSGWWHWVIFNIPPDITGLEAGAGNPDKGLAPRGSIQSLTDFGTHGYSGACPPKGDKPHRYIFTVYALDVPMLNADEKAHPPMVGFLLFQHTLAKASLVTHYGR